MNLTNLNKITTKQKVATSSLFFLTVLSLVFYFAVMANLSKIQQLRLDIVAQKINLEKKLNKERNMSQLSNKMKAIEPEIKRLNSVFVDKSGQIEFITTLEGIAQQNQITQKINLSQAANKEGKTYQVSQLTINSSGDLKNIINYLRLLESMTYYININSISMSKNTAAAASIPGDRMPQASTDSKIDVAISATTYWK